MKITEYRYLVAADFYRLNAKVGLRPVLLELLRGESFKYVFWMRTCTFTRSLPGVRYLLHPIARFFLRHYRYKYGISIPFSMQIGSGFYIGHIGNIVVNENAVIGKNCNISSGVTIGRTNRGLRKGYPRLGDNIYIGPGAKIIGGVVIGNNVAIGANCVVTKDVPDNAVIVGVPGRVISSKGSADYVRRTDYEARLAQ
jgi:serine O-acetyltransferase